MNAHAKPLIGSLSDNAILASLTISQWSARRFDRKASDDVTTRNGADASAARVNKQLIGRDALADIQSAVSEARTKHYTLTLPWAAGGSAILAAESYLKYRDAMLPLKERFDRAAAKFCAEYPALREAARKSLGDLFNVEDYPQESDIARRFSMSLSFSPVPSGGDFRVNIHADALEALREEIERSTREASVSAVRDVFRRVNDVMATMAEKLSGYQPATDDAKASGVFRDSLVGNVRELADAMPALNVFGDPLISDLAAKLRDVSKTDASVLRENDSLREATAKEAARLAEVAGAFL